MAVRVPYLAAEQIEREAAALLAQYAHARGGVVAPPIPVDDIIEKHFRLGLELDDLHERFDVPRFGDGPDILGVIDFGERRVTVDESLDPEDFPSQEGRFRFTLAHEGGHWWLHRSLFAADSAQARLFGAPAVPSVVCRSSEEAEPVEWQANRFAASLLMPRKWVADAWRGAFGNDQPFAFVPAQHAATTPRRYQTGPRPLRTFGRGIAEPECLRCFEDIARQLAPLFGVSVEALRIRLEQLGFLLRQPASQRTLDVWS